MHTIYAPVRGRTFGIQSEFSLLATVTVVIVTTITMPSTAAAAAPRPVAFDSATPAEQPDDASALAAATATGKAVAIVNRRTETMEVLREPDGTYRELQSLSPVRMRQGERWVPVDATLAVRPDGSIAPKAVPVTIRLSGGGDRTIAEMTDDGSQMALQWPLGQLPKPRLDGPTAVYPNVLPDVDLEVTAKSAGFSEVLVIKNREAAKNPALKKVSFGLRTSGLDVSTDPVTGTLAARDAVGQVKFQSGTPFAWSEGKASVAAGVATRSTSKEPPSKADIAPRLTRLRVESTPGTLAVIPGTGFLDAPADAFPLVVDPDFWAGTRGNWTTIVSGNYANSTFWNGLPPGDGGRVKVGRIPGENKIARSLFQMQTGATNGKIIVKAEFKIWHRYSWNCSPRPGAQLMLANAINRNTTWNNRPAFHYDTARTAVSQPCQNAWHTYDITDLMQRAANSRWPNLTMGLQAQDENSEQHWRRYNGDDGSPTVHVVYRDHPTPPANAAPDAPADLSTVPVTPCRSGSERVKVGAGDLRFSARLTDPNGDNVNGFLDFWGKDEEQHHPKAPESGYVPSGTTVTWTVAAGTLRQNVVYDYNSRSSDNKIFGATSETCQIEVDTVAPAHAPTVSSGDYPADPSRSFGSVGRTGTFTFDNGGDADVTGFLYGLQDPPATAVDVAANGRTNVKITPSRRGPNTLYVRAVDGAGNRGPVNQYTFRVNTEAAPAAWWPLDETNGAIADDASGNTRTLTATGSIAWIPGRPSAEGNAVSLNGSDAALATSKQVADTTNSFAVSAWVRPSRVEGDRWPTAISQEGNRTSAFALRYGGANSQWTFTRMRSDADDAPHDNVQGVSRVRAGEWTHIAGVYDDASRIMTLYVNGIPEATGRAGEGGFSAGGPLAVGRAKWNGVLGNHWAGEVDDAVVWNRALSDDEILAVASGGMGARAKVVEATGSKPCMSEEVADRAVDGVVIGDPRAKWCSWAEGERWLQLKLAGPTTLTNVIVRHASSGGEDPTLNTKDFDLQTSEDGVTWTTAAQIRGNAAGVTNTRFDAPIRASYVRLKIITAGQKLPEAARVYEVGIYDA